MAPELRPILLWSSCLKLLDNSILLELRGVTWDVDHEGGDR